MVSMAEQREQNQTMLSDMWKGGRFMKLLNYDKKEFNIMTSCDNNLVPYVAVGLTAMAHNLKDADIDFFFSTVMSVRGTGWTGEAYYSLCAHLLLPDEIDRVLYLDAGEFDD